MRLLLLVLAATMLLTACGQKGPLYLPEPSSSTINSSEAAA